MHHGHQFDVRIPHPPHYKKKIKTKQGTLNRVLLHLKGDFQRTLKNKCVQYIFQSIHILTVTFSISPFKRDMICFMNEIPQAQTNRQPMTQDETAAALGFITTHSRHILSQEQNTPISEGENIDNKTQIEDQADPIPQSTDQMENLDLEEGL